MQVSNLLPSSPRLPLKILSRRRWKKCTFSIQISLGKKFSDSSNRWEAIPICTSGRTLHSFIYPAVRTSPTISGADSRMKVTIVYTSSVARVLNIYPGVTISWNIYCEESIYAIGSMNVLAMQFKWPGVPLIETRMYYLSDLESIADLKPINYFRHCLGPTY